MKRYDKYIDSGVEWIGEIPVEWEVKKLKYLVGYIKGYAFKTETFKENGIPIIKASDIKNLSIRKGKDFISKSDSENFSKVKLDAGDIIISTVGSTPDVLNSAVGQIAKVPNSSAGSFLNQNTVKFFTKDSKLIHNNFLFYLLISNGYRKYLDLIAHGTANQASLNIEDMLNFNAVIPLVSEQIEIVNFLDYKIQRINDLIEKKEKLIDCLKEERNALIDQSVTSGLNTKVGFKTISGEWISKIPEHWELKKLKYVSLIQPSNVDKKSIEGEDEVLLCNYVDVYKNEILTDSINFMKATATKAEINKFKLKIGDVLITKDSETPQDIAVPALVKIERDNLVCGYHLAQIRANNVDLMGEFLLRLFQSKCFNSYFEISANGVTRYGLGVDAIKNVLVPLPPISEQLKITSYISKQCSIISNSISKIDKEIELIKEFRVSLINEVITGKIKIT